MTLAQLRVTELRKYFPILKIEYVKRNKPLYSNIHFRLHKRRFHHIDKNGELLENVDNPDYNERDPTKYKHKCNRCTRRYQKLSHLERHALKCVSKEILIIFESCFNRTFLIHVTGWHCSSVIETNVAKESRWPFLMCRARFVFPILVYSILKLKIYSTF